MKDNLLQQEKHEFFSGSGKTVKEASNFIHQKFQQKKHLLKLFSFLILHKQFQVLKKVSSLFGTLV